MFANKESGSSSSNAPNINLPETKKGQEIKKLIEDYQYVNDMPDCAEKSFIKLYIHYRIKSDLPDLKELPSYLLSETEKKEIAAKALKKLTGQIYAEGINNGPKIRQLLASISNKSSLNDGEWAELFLNALKEIQPLNIPLMTHLLVDAKNQVDLTDNPELIILFGNIGAGKSSTLHYLAGESFKLLQKGGKDHFEPNNEHIKDESLKQKLNSSAFSTSPYAHSETREINVLTIQENGKTIHICDTPGFKDTAGPERDIANSIRLQEVSAKASRKPIIVISQFGVGDRLDILYEILDKVAKIIPGLGDSDKKLAGKTTYLFTKYNKSQLDGLIEQLEEFCKEARVKNNLSVAILANDMVVAAKQAQQTKSYSPTLSFATDTNLAEHRTQLLAHLASIVAIPASAENTEYEITGKENTATLENQLEKQLFSINKALENKNYNLLKFKIDQLKNLNKALGRKFPLVDITLVKAKEAVAAYIEKLTDELNTNKDIILANNFELDNAGAITKFTDSIKALVSFAPDNTNECIADIYQKQQELIAKITANTDIETIVKSFKKIELLSAFVEHFPDNSGAQLEESKTTAVNAVNSAVRTLIAQAKESVDNNNPIQFAARLKKKLMIPPLRLLDKI